MTEEISGRVVLVPGYVVSKTDGQAHWVGAGRLAELYGVPLNRCIVWDPINNPQRLWRHNPNTDVLLYPKDDGNYELPKRAKELLA